MMKRWRAAPWWAGWALILAGCGGGGGQGTDGTPSSGAGGLSASEQRLASALSSGDPSSLESTDTATLLERAIAEASARRAVESSVLSALYGDAGTAMDLSLNISNNSATVTPLSSTSAVAHLLSDSGAGIAAVTLRGSGRGLAYGADVLQWMAGTSKEQQHYPQFLRSFKWLMTGSGTGTLATTIKYASAGYTAANIKNFITRTGATATAVDCAVGDPGNSCWNNADLIVFGSGVAANAELSAQVKRYLEAGKAVIYMHPSWVQSAGGSQVLEGLGMKLGGYPGNYFAAAAGVSVSSTRTVADRKSVV